MIYHDPEAVTSPQEFIETVDVLFDGGFDSFSVARIVWEGTPCLAMRWNVARREHDDPEKISGSKVCVGMPSSHGYPVWFIIPPEMLDRNSSVWKTIDNGTNIA